MIFPVQFLGIIGLFVFQVILVACVAAVALADKAPVYHQPPVYAAPAYHAPAPYKQPEYPTVSIPVWWLSNGLPCPISIKQGHVPVG